MRDNQPLGARLALVFVFFVALILTGCKGGTGSASSSASANVYYDAHTQTLGEPPSSNLQWMAPATRADGSKLYAGEIRGYRIYYKLRHQDAYRVIDINDASSTSYSLKGFSPGVYEFSVTTLDMEGLESQRSKPVSVNII